MKKEVSIIRTTVLFLLAAIPGLVVFLSSSWWLILILLDPRKLELAVPAFLGALVGFLGILVGTGRWGQWLHAVVFVTLPFVLMALAVAIAAIFGLEIVLPLVPAGLAAGFLATWACRRIDRYYRDRANQAPMARPGV